MGKVIKALNKQNIKLNITAVYNSSQTKKILKNINKKTPVIVSIFAGRMADVGKILFLNLKIACSMQINLKMLKYCGQVLVKRIIILRLEIKNVILSLYLLKL